MNSEPAPDPLEGVYADVHLIEDAILAEIRHAEWSSTGGHAKGCALCTGKTFRERVTAGGHHIDCAREMARVEGAEGVRAALVCGGLRATLARVVADPRLGEWKQHLDWWADHS